MNKNLFEGFNDLKPDRSLILKIQIKMEEEVQRTPKRTGGNNNMRKIYRVAALSFILIAGMFISNQQQKPSSLLPTVASSNEGLPVVGNDQNLKRLLSEVESNQSGSMGMAGGGSPTEDSRSTMKSAASVSQNLSAEPGGATYSGTNLQVEGVDEADIVKTDGNYLYQISNDPKENNNPQVVISKINPASDLKVVSRLEFDSKEFRPLEMYVDSKTLVIIGTSYERMDSAQINEKNDSMSSKSPQSVGSIGGPLTKMLVFNLEDKNNPKKLRELKLDGNYVSSRKIGSAVYFVVNKYIDYYRILKEDQVPAKPKYYDSVCQDSYKEVNFSEIRYFPDTIEPNYLMIAGIDLDHPDKEAEVSTYLGSGRNIYASTSNLYVAMPHYEFEQSASTQEPAVKDAISKMPANITTQIYKFGFNQGEILYQGKGEVPGQILNQFSMDEYQGHFRIATTKGEIWAASGNESTNNVYTLDQNMQVSGKLEGLAPGERIYSVRFMGDRAYMVTFKQVDPLFVIDLKDPKQPKALGELKIPGYSDYLQPYDENHLIGIGKETVETTLSSGPNGGQQTMAFYLGMKLAMFDVSDVTNPKELFKETIGDRGTDSEVLRNHKALLFDKEKNLLAFPVVVYENKDPQQKEVSPNNPPQYGQITFQGAYVYTVNLEQGFTLKGKITHVKDTLQKSRIDQSAIQRILFVGENLYTVSAGKIKVNDLKTLDEKGTLDIQ